MKKDLKVSIITVCYNAEPSIAKTIQSVLLQSYPNIEYIVIDGQSTDGTFAIIQQYKHKITKIVSEQDEGVYDAMNNGIQCAKGDIIYFLNADDVFCDKLAVSDIVKIFGEDSSAGIVYGNAKVINIPQNIKFNPQVGFNSEIKTKNDLWKIGICHQRVFAKRDIFNKIGLFSLKYKIFADRVWLIQAYKNDVKFQHVKRDVVIWNYQGMSYKNRTSALLYEKPVMIFKNYSFSDFCYYLTYLGMNVLLRQFKSKN
jgi:glycosyltransferase